MGETRHWMNLASEKSVGGVSVVVCGFSQIDEVKTIGEDFPSLKTEAILLDARVAVIEQRLRARNSDETRRLDLARVVGSVEDFIDRNSKSAPMVRKTFQRHRSPIIDASDLAPARVAAEVTKFLR